MDKIQFTSAINISDLTFSDVCGDAPITVGTAAHRVLNKSIQTISYEFPRSTKYERCQRPGATTIMVATRTSLGGLPSAEFASRPKQGRISDALSL